MAALHFDQRGRVLLEDSFGESWLVVEANEALYFITHTESRRFAPVSVAWKELSADELEFYLRAAAPTR